MPVPRILRISASVRDNKLSLPKCTSPCITLAAEGSRRIMDRAVIDFPLPLSPTRAKVSPALIEKLMPFIASTVSSSLGICVTKLETVKTLAAEGFVDGSSGLNVSGLNVVVSDMLSPSWI